MKTLRAVVPLLAAGLAGAALPLSGGPAAVAAAEEKKFSGYSATTTASPVKIEIYEPTIPIPNTPQAELELGYTRIIADSTSSRGRASYLWPGDPVGEGAKVIIDNLHLPPEIGGPLGEQGYPMQVNSGYPSGPASDADQPFPGTVMYTTAAENETVAEAGYSSQCELDNAGEGEGDGGESGGAGVPGLPELPGLPGLPGLDALEELMAAGVERSSVPASRTFSRAGTGSSAASAEGDAPACQISPELAALVSFGGYAAVSKTARSAEEATSRSRAAVSDVSLLGGVVTFSGVSASAVSTSDGTKPVGKGSASYGTITIAGEEFGIGPEGIQGGGESHPIPALPDDPNAALAQLGITVTVPKPVYEEKGQRLTSTVEGLIVTIDTKTFSAALKQLQLEQVIAQFPDDMKDLKKFLQAVVNLSPRFVVHLAYTSSRINTVQGIEIPPVVPDNDPDAEEETEDDTSAAGSSTGSTSGAGGSGLSGGTAPAATGSAPSTEGALNDAALSSGLPPLFSIPTLLFVVALGGAAAIGSYVRRAGLLTLGAGAACSHGLNSGLPDLRRIQ